MSVLILARVNVEAKESALANLPVTPVPTRSGFSVLPNHGAQGVVRLSRSKLRHSNGLAGIINCVPEAKIAVGHSSQICDHSVLPNERVLIEPRWVKERADCVAGSIH